MPQCRLLRTVMYHVLSLIQSGMSMDVLRVLHGAQGVLLQIMRRRSYAASVTTSREGDRIVFDWRSGRSPCVTRAAGVQVRIHQGPTRLQHIAGVFSPPPVLQGCAGAVRLRTPAADLLLVSLYVALQSHTDTQVVVYDKDTRALFTCMAGLARSGVLTFGGVWAPRESGSVRIFMLGGLESQCGRPRFKRADPLRTHRAEGDGISAGEDINLPWHGPQRHPRFCGGRPPARARR